MALPNARAMSFLLTGVRFMQTSASLQARIRSERKDIQGLLHQIKENSEIGNGKLDRSETTSVTASQHTASEALNPKLQLSIAQIVGQTGEEKESPIHASVVQREYPDAGQIVRDIPITALAKQDPEVGSKAKKLSDSNGTVSSIEEAGVSRFNFGPSYSSWTDQKRIPIPSDGLPSQHSYEISDKKGKPSLATGTSPNSPWR